MRLSVQIEFDKTLDLVTHKRSVVVGRSNKCDLVIPHEAISRQHCQIELVKDQFYITDLGSSNGVSVNGKKIPINTKLPLPPDFHLELGKLNCELSHSAKIPEAKPKIVNSTIADSGDFTATLRISRLELNRPSVTLELEKQQKMAPPRPKNPVLIDDSEVEIAPASSAPKKILLLLLGLLILAAAWFMAPDNL